MNAKVYPRSLTLALVLIFACYLFAPFADPSLFVCGQLETQAEVQRLQAALSEKRATLELKNRQANDKLEQIMGVT